MIMKVVTFFSSKNRRVLHIQTSTFAIVNTVKKLWIRDFKIKPEISIFASLKISTFLAIQVTEGPHSVQKRFLNVMSHVVL